MSPPQGRTRDRILLLAALLGVWLAVLVAVWWRAPAPDQPARPTRAAGEPGAAARPPASAALPATPASATSPPAAPALAR